MPVNRSDMLEQNVVSSILFVDSLAGDRGHLLDDDLLLAECLAPLAREFLVATSSASAARLRRQLNVGTWETQFLDERARFQRPRLLRLVLSLPGARFQHVVFQSFEEISALLFMLRHPARRVHLIATNNLRPERLKRHPLLGRFFLRAVLRRAASVMVHSQYEVDRVKEIAPKIDPGKVFVKPFHQFSASRDRIPWDKKSRTMLFLGPELTHKRIAPVVDLIEADKDHCYRYLFCSMSDRMAPEMRAFLESRENVEVRFGYTPNDEYYRLFSQAAVVILTHDKAFEGVLSGVFCDAIASGTPVIARDMAPYDEFFERFGPMGFLVDYTNPQWCKRVSALDLAERYAEFQRHMAACRESCSMEAIRSVFRAALSRA